MAGPDLHVHSTASDGALTPAELVTRARHLGVPAIAITDHDTVDAVAAALAASEGTPVTVIPGVELSAGVGERSVHILGYYIDHTNETLLERLVTLRTARVHRAERIVEALRADGFLITLSDVMDSANGGAVGRAHIAQLLVDAGHASSVPEAFSELLGSSAPYYVPKPVSSAEEVIGWVHAAGGVAVLAHPALSHADDLLPALVEAGIVGVEAFHGAHSESERSRYVGLASRYGLIVTGGSDFHGDKHEGGELGSANVPPECVAALEHARLQRHSNL